MFINGYYELSITIVMNLITSMSLPNDQIPPAPLVDGDVVVLSPEAFCTATMRQSAPVLTASGPNAEELAP